MRGFVLGLQVGIVLGILVVLKGRGESRDELTERAADLADSARETLENGQGQMHSEPASMKGAAERAVNQARTGTDSN